MTRRGMSSGHSHFHFLPRHPVKLEICYPFYVLAVSVHTPLRNEKIGFGSAINSETYSVMMSRELKPNTSGSILTSQSESRFARFAPLAEILVVPLWRLIAPHCLSLRLPLGKLESKLPELQLNASIPLLNILCYVKLGLLQRIKWVNRHNC